MLNTIKLAMTEVHSVLSGIAGGKGQQVHSINISVKNTDLDSGKIAGTVTVNNRSRYNFSIVANNRTAEVKFMGETRQIVA